MAEYHRREVDALTPDYDLVPPHLRRGLQGYIQDGHVPGDFLQAVITNNLMAAVAYGDEVSRAALCDLVFWMYKHAPGVCWGTKEIMDKWSSGGGLTGGAP